MRRRILARLVILAVATLALAGCVRFQADLRLTPDETVEGRIVVAVLAADESEEAVAEAREAARSLEAELLGDLRESDAEVTDYADDGYVGSTIDLRGVPLSAFNGADDRALRFERLGDEVVFTGSLDFGEGEAPPEETTEDPGDLTVSITFPGAVSSHNGELSGSTVSWSTTLDEPLEMEARGSVTPTGPSPLIVAAVAVAVLGAAVVTIAVVARRRTSMAPVDAADPPSTP